MKTDENNHLYIEIQNDALGPIYDQALDELVEQLEYIPPPPDPFRPPASKKQAQEEVRKELKSLLMAQEARERCIKGTDIILEELKTVTNGSLCQQEFLRAGDLLVEKISSTSDDDEESNVLLNPPPGLYEILKMSFDTFATIYQVGNKLFTDEKFDDAVCVYEVLTLLDNSSDTCWSAAGLCHYRLERWKDAAYCFEMAAGINLAEIKHITNAGYCYIKLKDFDSAREEIHTAEQMLKTSDVNPQEKRVHVNTIEELKKLAA